MKVYLCNDFTKVVCYIFIFTQLADAFIHLHLLITNQYALLSQMYGGSWHSVVVEVFASRAEGKENRDENAAH